MNTQETQALEDFLNQLVRARGIVKDPQADRMIFGAAAQQPDALYLLVQRALLMEQALNKAKTEVASLQNQLQAAKSVTTRGFLDAEAWGNTPAAASQPVTSAPTPPAPALMQPAGMPAMPAMPAHAPAASPGFFSGGLGGTLGTVAATAAGVAGGAFLFQGIEHLMHPGGGAGFMNQSGTAFSAPPVENTTINNYYEGASASDSGSAVGDLSADDSSWDDGLA